MWWWGSQSLEPFIYLDKTTAKLTSNMLMFLPWTGHNKLFLPSGSVFSLPYPNIKMKPLREHNISNPKWCFSVRSSSLQLRSSSNPNLVAILFQVAVNINNRHKHTVQVVRKSLPKISQAPLRQTSFLWLSSVLQGPAHSCLPHSRSHWGLLWKSVPLPFLFKLLCVSLEAVSLWPGQTTSPCGSGITAH